MGEMLAEAGRIAGPVTETSGEIIFGFAAFWHEADWPEADKIRRAGQPDGGPERGRPDYRPVQSR